VELPERAEFSAGSTDLLASMDRSPASWLSASMREHAAEPGARQTSSHARLKAESAPRSNQQPAPRSAPTPVSALQLQQLAGNRAVTSIVDRIARETLQRVAVKESPPNETLYNQPGAGGTAGAAQYGGDVSYDMTRNGDAGVTITIKIQFLNQARNGVDPTAPGAPAGTPRLGALLGSPTEIPATDPDNRRAWCQNIVKEQVKPWNGKLTFVGEEVNIIDANTKKRLPVTFNSVAVFGLGESYDKRIIVHPTSTQANPATGNPIDAGNYYLNKGNYTADDSVIAAHEYGHLLGIDDEYSQSNEMLNGLLHQAAPGSAPSAMKALDKKTVERMVLSALRAPLIAQLNTMIPAVTDAFRAKRALVKTKMAAAARSGVVDAAVRTALEQNLTAASEPGLGPSVPRAVAFQTTANFSNVTAAGEGVEAGFSAAAMSAQISAAYQATLSSAQNATVNLAGVGATSINVHGSVPAMSAAGGAQQANAAGAAATTVGSGGGQVNVFGFPLLYPPSGLVGKLQALPATWGTAGSAVESGVTPAAFAMKMAQLVKSATAAAAAPPPPGAAAPAPKMRGAGELYRKAYAIVSSMARETCRQLSTDLIGGVVQPVLTTSVADLESTIGAEVTKVMGTPASGVAALGPPNPQMAALVAHMKAQLDADKAATAGGGRSPLGAGKAAPDQNVTYTVQSLMGGSRDTSIRADQFNPMVRQFNSKLKNLWEKTFTAEVK
jgi:hypothetical protein